MIVGIDLGTTNSLCALFKDEKTELVPNALSHVLTPSVVGLDDNDEILVGAAARERLLTHPDRTAASFKRYMGSNRTLRLGRKKFLPEELSALVLKSLKADAEAFLGETVTEAVITVPAYFNDRQRKATRIAGQLAGLKVERLLNEPTAAALAYGLHLRATETKFLVFDLGGGTFDVSVLELFEGVIEVRSTAGDNFLGGEDFVDVLVKGFTAHAEREGASLPAIEGKLAAALRAEAERVKRELSRDESATMTLRTPEVEISWTVTEDAFNGLSDKLLARLTAPVERALRDARIRSTELSEIVLVGGATRMPILRKLVSRMFGRFPNSQLHPDETVAVGAAIQAGLKSRDQALAEVVITDVCPYTLGVEVSRQIGNEYEAGHFMPILERNVVVPASRVDRVCTIADGQKQVKLAIYQGESRHTKDNIYLGVIQVPVPPRPAGEESIDVRFTYDINGLLEVEATVVSNSVQKRIVIEEAPGVLTAEEVQARLAALAELKIHPRDNAENRTILARAERLYEELLAEERAYLAEQIAAFEVVLKKQDPGAIRTARGNLTAILDELDRRSWL